MIEHNEQPGTRVRVKSSYGIAAWHDEEGTLLKSVPFDKWYVQFASGQRLIDRHDLEVVARRKCWACGESARATPRYCAQHADFDAHVLRFVITHERNGERMLTFARQGRWTFETRELAQAHLDIMRPEWSARFPNIDNGTLRVEEWECWPGHFDPKHPKGKGIARYEVWTPDAPADGIYPASVGVTSSARLEGVFEQREDADAYGHSLHTIGVSRFAVREVLAPIDPTGF